MFPSSPTPDDRMVTFFIALLLFSFCYSNILTRIIVAVASVMFSVLIAWCIQRAWESSDGREEWFHNLVPSIRRAFSHAYDKCHVLFVVTRREDPSPHAPGDDNSVHWTPGHEEGGVV